MGNLGSLYECLCEFVVFGLKNGTILIMPSQCLQRQCYDIKQAHSGQILSLMNLRIYD